MSAPSKPAPRRRHEFLARWPLHILGSFVFGAVFGLLYSFYRNPPPPDVPLLASANAPTTAAAAREPVARVVAAPRQSVDPGSIAATTSDRTKGGALPQKRTSPANSSKPKPPRPVPSRNSRFVGPVDRTAGLLEIASAPISALPTARTLTLDPVVTAPATSAAAPIETAHDRVRKVLDVYRTSRIGQVVTFDRCDVALVGAVGTARCRGEIRYTGRVGGTQPQPRRMTWTFDLKEQSGQWAIVNTRAR